MLKWFNRKYNKKKTATTTTQSSVANYHQLKTLNNSNDNNDILDTNSSSIVNALNPTNIINNHRQQQQQQQHKASKLCSKSICNSANTNKNCHHNKVNLNYFIKIKLKTCAISLFTILMYYMFSISLTFYNKMLFVTYKYPLSITVIHLIIKFLLSMFFRYLMYICTSQQRIILNWQLYAKRIIPTGIAAAIDIGLSNWSLQYITVALYTMSKSTVILFVLLFSILFRVEKWRWPLAFIGIFISLGLFLFTFHSTEFNLFGFVLVMLASLFSGIRWTLAQILTQKHEIGLSNPADMMYHIQPGMIISLLPLAVYVEGVSVITTDKFFRTTDFIKFSNNSLFILLGAFLAFLLEGSEYLVVSYTSSITLSISGIFKEICTIYLAVKLNGDHLNTMNAVGLLICLCGIILHVFLKVKQEMTKPDEESSSSRQSGSLRKTQSFQNDSMTTQFNDNSFDSDDYQQSRNHSGPLLNQQYSQ